MINSWRRSWRDHRESWITAALIVASLLDVILLVRPSLDISYLLSVIGCLALVLRRRAPWICFLLTIPGMAYGYILIGGAVALYSLVVERRLSWHRALLAGLPLLISEIIVFPISDFLAISPAHLIVHIEYAALYELAPVALGRFVLVQRQLVGALRQAQQDREDRVHARVQQAVTDERLRISRDLHDVVAHQVTLVAVRSTALSVQSDDPEVRRIGSDIRGLSRRTLRELRSTLATLRTSDGDAPVPHQANIQELITASGSPVEMSGDPIPDAAGEVLSRTIYRVIQESLTNVERHAPGSAVRIRTRDLGNELAITVENDRPVGDGAPRPTEFDSSGLGLIGLEERVRAIRGIFHAGPTSSGGWKVAVTLPADRGYGAPPIGRPPS